MRDLLINNFLRISSVPRGSGNEERIADFLVSIAKENNLYYFKDKNNNVLIKKKGNINSKPVALQAHLDMVCVKGRDSNHDFEKEGIEVIIDGDKVTAKDTSLGADQGVGLSMMLSIMEDNTLKHPDLEFIFTTEEETTFNGAITFPYDKVESKRLINLDCAHDNYLVNGADGDILNEYIFKGQMRDNNLPSYKVVISGFPGGNSGDNIELSANNAIATMANLLNGKEIFLKRINGGTFENDLATSCEVIINTNLDVENIFKGINHHVEKLDNKETFSKEETESIIKEILELKGGYITKSGTSANLGLIRTENNEVKIYYIIRSLDEVELESLSNESKNMSNHFQVKEIYTDSAWHVNDDSNLSKIYKNIYFEEYREYPMETIGHGGTECSAIKKRIDGLDMISIGANIEEFHTTEEVTYISSWVKTYGLLISLLKKL